MNEIFPDLYKHLKLVSSTPIRNMATLAGNFVNASPIGDMTVWFLALDADVMLGTQESAEPGAIATGFFRSCKLYLGYKQLAQQPGEMIKKIRFKKPLADFRFNFEKVCKRTYLDIASVNTAISMNTFERLPSGTLVLQSAHVSAGGVAPIPLYLKETSDLPQRQGRVRRNDHRRKRNNAVRDLADLRCPWNGTI